MLLRKLTTWSVCIVAVALAANAVRLIANRFWGDVAASLTEPAHVTPYTVALKVSWIEPGNAPVLRWEETQAVRSDGSSVRWERGVRPSGPYVTRDIYLVEGLRISTDDVAEIKTSSPIENAVRRLRDPNHRCERSLAGERLVVSEDVLSEGVVGEYTVIRLRLPRSIGSFAPTLGCALLAETGQGGATGYMLKEATSVRPGEPDPVLFSIPASFREVPPSAFMSSPPDSGRAKAFDQAYADAWRKVTGGKYDRFHQERELPHAR